MLARMRPFNPLCLSVTRSWLPVIEVEEGPNRAARSLFWELLELGASDFWLIGLVPMRISSSIIQYLPSLPLSLCTLFPFFSTLYLGVGWSWRDVKQRFQGTDLRRLPLFAARNSSRPHLGYSPSRNPRNDQQIHDGSVSSLIFQLFCCFRPLLSNVHELVVQQPLQINGLI